MGGGLSETKMPEAAEEPDLEPEPEKYNSSVQSLVLLSVLAAEFYLDKKCYYDLIALYNQLALSFKHLPLGAGEA